MKIIMVAVVSANGKLTNGNDPNIYKWTSIDDQEFFFGLIREASLIVMGSGTYEVVKSNLTDSTDSSRASTGQPSQKLRIILTRSPDEYSAKQIQGQLEFSSETPTELARRLSKKYKQMLLVGGAKIYSSFMKENLVDEIYLTVEPVIFGSGKNLFEESEFESRLKLISIKKLNKTGTVLLKYKILK